MTAVCGRTAMAASIKSLAAVPGGVLMVSVDTPVSADAAVDPRTVMS
jgi:hypothetical protein